MRVKASEITVSAWVLSYVLELIPLAYYNLLLLEHFVLREVKSRVSEARKKAIYGIDKIVLFSEPHNTHY